MAKPQGAIAPESGECRVYLTLALRPGAAFFAPSVEILGRLG